jgi:hypothetical protein
MKEEENKTERRKKEEETVRKWGGERGENKFKVENARGSSHYFFRFVKVQAGKSG